MLNGISGFASPFSTFFSTFNSLRFQVSNPKEVKETQVQEAQELVPDGDEGYGAVNYTA